ncbi:endonuclease/exonuclease/phosphatase family protein [Bacteroidota bacterium]
MNRISKLILLLHFLILTSCDVSKKETSDYVIIGTFNIAWLGDGSDDKINRTEEDYENIADVIKNTKADVLGLEEIENEAALQRLTKYLTDYEFYVSSQSGSQNPAILYKKGLEVEFICDYMPIAVVENRTKPGLVFQVKKRNFDWLIMIVHFKSTSRYDSTDELKEESRKIRTSQAEVLGYWIDSVLSIGSEQDIIIVGDFNDYPTRINNATLTPLTDRNNMDFISSGMESCKYDYLSSIDHILISTSAGTRYLNNSVRIYDIYSSLPDEAAGKVSDHCPVLANFDIKLHDND